MDDLPDLVRRFVGLPDLVRRCAIASLQFHGLVLIMLLTTGDRRYRPAMMM
jgi:hypothetical protein